MNTLIPDDVDFKLTIPHENFNREIGNFGGKRCTTEGALFEGSDEEWEEYVKIVLPTPEDETLLKELFEQEWIENKPMSARQIATGIGATA